MTVARMWRGWIRTEDRGAYRDYLEETGVGEYRRTRGNEGAWMLFRDEADGRTEVVTWSLWSSREAIAAFAGEDIEQARFYPEDDRFLVDREETVHHYDVVG